MNDAPYQTLAFDETGAIATITIDRPDKLNALDSLVLRELIDAVSRVRRSGARAAIVTGRGDKAFVAGADIAEMSAMSVAEALAFSEMGHRVMRDIERAPCPFIAAVNGFALGGGCELALACDFIYASDKAKFGQPEVSLGLLPGFGGTQRLARRVGLGLARELIYTGDHIDAARALAIGLVNEIVPHVQLSARVRAVAERIATRAPLAVTASKRTMARGYDADLSVACAIEARAFGALFATSDMRHGTRAFLDRKKPEFSGR